MVLPRQIVIGTAGHIDHGKSRLVLALTGTDPDRLAEEKDRGMTIDLGFAVLRAEDATVYFVDVPGHERFIRNMVAGATGVDVALLVVAADDSVMPQTREHAELLSLLGVRRCVVVLNKMDLVDDEWADAVEEEVRDLLGSLNLEPLRVLRASAESGRGIDELRTCLLSLARSDDQPQTSGWFRLPIDRAFSITGRGTVVTGSVMHGAAAPGDELELWPAGKLVRLRDLETHRAHAGRAAGRMRLGANLASIPLTDVQRGCELATPGYLEASRFLDVEIEWLTMPGKTRRQNIRLRLHLATRELLAELRLLEPPADLRVQKTFGQLRCAEPVVAAWGQRFILRDEAGARTLGGGRVLRPVTRPWTAKHPAHQPGLQALAGDVPEARLAEVIRAAEWNTCAEPRLVTRAGLRDLDELRDLLGRLRGKQQVQVIEVSSTPTYIHADHLQRLQTQLAQRLGRYLADNPRRAGVPRVEWPAWMPKACPARLHPALIEWLFAQECVALDKEMVVPVDHSDRLPPADEALLSQILDELADAGFQPPAPASLSAITPKNSRRARELIKWALARGRLVRISDDILLHEQRWEELSRTVVAAIRDGGGVTMSALRTLLGTTRKFAVPMAERLDAAGITKRKGDERVLGPNAGRYT